MSRPDTLDRLGALSAIPPVRMFMCALCVKAVRQALCERVLTARYKRRRIGENAHSHLMVVSLSGSSVDGRWERSMVFHPVKSSSVCIVEGHRT
jgi:hypothetical protein